MCIAGYFLKFSFKPLTEVTYGYFRGRTSHEMGISHISKTTGPILTKNVQCIVHVMSNMRLTMYCVLF